MQLKGTDKFWTIIKLEDRLSDLKGEGWDHDPSGRGCALAGRGDEIGCKLCLTEIALAAAKAA